MTSPTLSARSRTYRLGWRTPLTLLLALLVSIPAVLALPSPPAFAAPIAVDQCNGVGAGPIGATTVLTCTVTVVNTIDGDSQGSTVTVDRLCGVDPCPGGNGTFTTTSTDLVTSVSQCNASSNDAAHPVTCNVVITNNISADTPGAEPVTAATVNQCVGSAQGGGGSTVCTPFPANTTGATVTQCNGSGNGGGGTVDCAVSPASETSPAIPLTVNQCNGTANPGGSVVTCRTSISTNITAAAPEPIPSPSSSPSATPTAGGDGGTTGDDDESDDGSTGGRGDGGSTDDGSGESDDGGTAAPPAGSPGDDSGTSLSSAPQVPRVPSGGVEAGGVHADRAPGSALLALGGVVLTGSAAALVLGMRRRGRA